MSSMTPQTRPVPPVLATDPTAWRDEREIREATDLGNGTLYPILWRLESASWVTSRRVAMPRPSPRRYYQLTELGVREASGTLTAARDGQDSTILSGDFGPN
jgi:DNA-binding PadR family transcriptional regulator